MKLKNMPLMDIHHISGTGGTRMHGTLHHHWYKQPTIHFILNVRLTTQSVTMTPLHGSWLLSGPMTKQLRT